MSTPEQNASLGLPGWGDNPLYLRARRGLSGLYFFFAFTLSLFDRSLGAWELVLELGSWK